MVYRYPDRHQHMLLPPSIEEYISPDAPVRAYDAIVDALDLTELGLDLNPSKTGCPQYDPSTMLKVLLYGYSYGVRSSRKLERELYYNLSFIWLAGGLKPDHKTLAECRRRNRQALAKTLKSTARLCLRLGLIEGNTLFIDGSKIRAHAGISNGWNEKRCQKNLVSIDRRIEEILKECETADMQETVDGSLVHLQEELADKTRLRSKVQAILKTLQEDTERHSFNTTDPDCVVVAGRQGTHAGYNGQIAVDEKHGLIVSAEAVNESTDMKQLARQVQNANDALDMPCQTVCADSGYSNIRIMEDVAQTGIDLVIPTIRQVANQAENAFDANHFTYHPQQDCYTCPAGQTLTFYGNEPGKQRKVYKAKPSVCRGCAYWGRCTTAKEGRKVSRLYREDFRQEVEAHYSSPEGQRVYALRKQKVEHPFGHLKYNLGVSGFLLRGLAGVRAEFGLLTSCFNITRMITLLGTRNLIKTLTAAIKPTFTVEFCSLAA